MIEYTVTKLVNLISAQKGKQYSYGTFFTRSPEDIGGLENAQDPSIKDS
jgi:hypothetical protein